MLALVMKPASLANVELKEKECLAKGYKIKAKPLSQFGQLSKNKKKGPPLADAGKENTSLVDQPEALLSIFANLASLKCHPAAKIEEDASTLPATAGRHPPPADDDEALLGCEDHPLFGAGDVVWAYVAGFPLWPSLISVDLKDNQFTKVQEGPKQKKRVYHVEFFEDKGCHCWIGHNTLFKFEGEAVKLLENAIFKQEIIRNSRIYEALKNALKGSRKNWLAAVKRAQQSLLLAKEDRVTFLRMASQPIPRGRQIQRKRKILASEKETAENDAPRVKKRCHSRKRQVSLTTDEASPPQGRGNESDHQSSTPTASPSPHRGIDATPKVSAPSVSRRRLVDEMFGRLDVVQQPEPSAGSAATESNDSSATTDLPNPMDDSDDEEVKTFKLARETEKRGPVMRVAVCERCGSRQGRLVHCSECRSSYHPKCANADPEAQSVVCPRCDPAADPKCCLCNTPSGQLSQCSFKKCHRRYHHDCLKNFHSPSVKQPKRPTEFVCPAHYCHTCVAEIGELGQPDKQSLLRCIECPTAFHLGEDCLAAGCEYLSVSQIRCYKHVNSTGVANHRKHSQMVKNVSWCGMCTEGGTLVCCERCPSSFHTTCAGLNCEPDGGFVCGECTAGKAILHGDIVWCKVGNYRWWPAKVYPLDAVPKVLRRREAKCGEMMVYFFGAHNSGFVYRGQVFHYQEGDHLTKVSQGKYIDKQFDLALKLVADVFRERQPMIAERAAQRRSKHYVKPPAYSHVLTNKPIGLVRIVQKKSDDACTCDCREVDPCGANCLNRMMQLECYPNACFENCKNQRFQRRANYSQLYWFNADGKGWGLKSRANIGKGDFVVEYCGELIDPQEYQRRLKAKQDNRDESYYFLTLDQNRIIDAGPSGSLARFMNHSCQPNCKSEKWTVLGDTRVGLFALVDIPANTELTFNYQLECAHDVVNETSKRQQLCRCGAANCTGFIGAKAASAKVIKSSVDKGKKLKK